MEAKTFAPAIFTTDNEFPPEAHAKNSEQIVLLLDNLAGNNSKMSMYSLYLFNSIVAPTKALQELFENLAEAELLHLKHISACVCSAGEEPRLWREAYGEKRYWTPAFNAYTLQPMIMLQNAIACEQAAIEKYDRQLKKECMDETLKAELKRIQEDDMLHLQILQEAIKTI